MKVKLIFLSILIGVFSILSVNVILCEGPCLSRTPYTYSTNDAYQDDCSILGNYNCKSTIIIEGSCDFPLIPTYHMCRVVPKYRTCYNRYCNQSTGYKCVSIPYGTYIDNGELSGNSCE